MDLLPMAMITSDRATRRLMHSALPDAPVVPDSPRRVRAPVLAGARATVARQLHRAAEAVAPPAPAPCDLAR